MSTHTTQIIINGEGFDSADDVAMAVCAALDWFNEFGPGAQTLHYVGDEAVISEREEI